MPTAYCSACRSSSCRFRWPTPCTRRRKPWILDPQWQFQLEQEQKLIRDCGAELHPDGTVTFPDDAARESYVAAALELNAMETEIEVPEIVLPENSGLSLSVNEIDALDGIVKWG